jgi:hypothetical protein
VSNRVIDWQPGFLATLVILKATFKHRPRPGVLRDRNDLKLLTGCTDYIPNSFTHQKPRHRRYEGNRTGPGVRFVLPHNTIFLYAPIVAPEGHRAPKGNSVS